MVKNTIHDAQALAGLGRSVRERLDADPACYRLPIEGLEVYGVANFLSPDECDRKLATP